MSDTIATKLARASARLDAAAARLAVPRERFVADAEGADLASFYLFLAIQECIDLASYWIAERGWEPAPSAPASFDTLAGKGVISARLADAMRAAAGLRNRIAHGDATVDHGRLHDEASSGVANVRAYLAALSAALEEPLP